MAAKKTKTFLKDPNSILDYSFDWTTWLDPGDIIASSTWTLDTGITQPFPATFDDFHTHVWVEGGVAGTSYSAVNHIMTHGGREEDATFIFTIQENF